MTIARPLVTFDGEHGDQRVGELLREVYEAARYAFENRDQLRARWLGLSKEVEARCPSRVRSQAPNSDGCVLGLMEADYNAVIPWKQPQVEPITAAADIADEVIVTEGETEVAFDILHKGGAL